jgi:transcriptional regulator with XRE-family HTH domain
MSSTKEHIAQRLRSLRKSLGNSAGGLAQETLAAQLDGITRAVLANVESARAYPSAGLVEELCKAFDVDAEWFLLGAGEMFRADAVAHKEWAARESDRFNRSLNVSLHSDSSQQEIDEANAQLEAERALDPEPAKPEPVAAHVQRAWLRFEEERRHVATREPRANYNASPTAPPAPELELELERMQDCIQVMLEATQARGVTPTPAKFAAACVLLYEASLSGGKTNENSVRRLLETLG